ncbi:MAG: BON domain-containing protein [Oceanicaulis sp.]
MRRISVFLLSGVAAFALSACAAVEPGRSAGRQLDDFNASLAVKSAMLRSEGYVLGGIDVEITEGVALLSGQAPRQTDRIYAECVTWSAPSVRQVVNDIAVGGRRDRMQAARDALITQQVRARLVSDRVVRSMNYNIETREGVVYLLGYARDDTERTIAAQQAATVPGVQRVVDLLRTPGDTSAPPARGALAAEACDAAGGRPVLPADPVLEGGPDAAPAFASELPPLAEPGAQPQDEPAPGTLTLLPPEPLAAPETEALQEDADAPEAMPF